MRDGKSGQGLDCFEQHAAEAVDRHPTVPGGPAQRSWHEQDGNEQQVVVAEQDVVDTEAKELGDLISQ